MKTRVKTSKIMKLYAHQLLHGMTNQRWSVPSNIIYFHSAQLSKHPFLFNDKSDTVHSFILNEINHLKAKVNQNPISAYITKITSFVV